MSVRALSCLLLAFSSCAEPPATSPPGWSPGTVWVAADRDGDALVELDEDLLVLGRRPLESPLLVRRGGGRVWVAHAPRGHPGAPQALRPWAATGPGPPVVVGAVVDLEVDPAGRALVLERPPDGTARLTRVVADGRACDLEAPPGAVGLALGPAGPALALGRRGWAVRARDGRWRERAALDGGAVLDLAPRPGGWWLLQRLSGEPAALCVAVDPAGVPTLVRPVGGAQRLARRAPGAWAWTVDGRELHAASGRPVALALVGARAAVGDRGGGLVVAAAGALLRLGPGGGPAPGQGGFARLVDVERAR